MDFDDKSCQDEPLRRAWHVDWLHPPDPIVSGLVDVHRVTDGGHKVNRRKENPTSDQSTQADRFATAARALGADEDEAAFKAKLAVITRQKPKEEQKVAATHPKKK